MLPYLSCYKSLCFFYFQGSWLNKFDKALTIDRDFHVTKDKIVKIPTMFKKAEFKFTESTELNAKVVLKNILSNYTYFRRKTNVS